MIETYTIRMRIESLSRSLASVSESFVAFNLISLLKTGKWHLVEKVPGGW